MINIKKWHIWTGIAVAFILGGVFTGFMRGLVAEYASDIASTYVQDEYQREWGLLNPVIYFQLAVLYLYTQNEEVLKYTSEDYYTMRTAYFYSTFILISVSMYTALSGRTSSMFSTLEMAIIPAILNTFSKRNRVIGYIGLGIVLTGLFFMNASK